MKRGEATGEGERGVELLSRMRKEHGYDKCFQGMPRHLLFSMLEHLLFRFILGAGDAGFHNMIGGRGLDMEESAGLRLTEANSLIDAMGETRLLGGKKCIPSLAKAVRHCLPVFRVVFTSEVVRDSVLASGNTGETSRYERLLGWLSSGAVEQTRNTTKKS